MINAATFFAFFNKSYERLDVILLKHRAHARAAIEGTLVGARD